MFAKKTSAGIFCLVGNIRNSPVGKVHLAWVSSGAHLRWLMCTQLPIWVVLSPLEPIMGNLIYLKGLDMILLGCWRETSKVAMFGSKANMTAAVLELNPALHTDSTIFSMGRSPLFHVICSITDVFCSLANSSNSLDNFTIMAATSHQFRF